MCVGNHHETIGSGAVVVIAAAQQRRETSLVMMGTEPCDPVHHVAYYCFDVDATTMSISQPAHLPYLTPCTIGLSHKVVKSTRKQGFGGFCLFSGCYLKGEGPGRSGGHLRNQSP